MPAARDITGQRFGRLVAIRCLGSDKHGKRQWEFACECGGLHTTTASSVLAAKIKSCGCLLRETSPKNGRIGRQKVSERKTKHGHSKVLLPEYAIWKSMRQRCANPNCRDYPKYGGRGIRVCDRWNDYSAFIADMGFRPSDRHSIDRINNDGNYEPANCRWADDFMQANNRRPRGTGEDALNKGAKHGH